MNVSAICPRKITLLKEKIIQVGELLELCKNYRESNEELISKDEAHLKQLGAVNQQYLQLLEEKESWRLLAEKLDTEVSHLKAAASEAQLQVDQLLQLIEVYKQEREEYGPDKMDEIQKKLRFAISEHVELCNNLKKPGFVFKSMSKAFQSQFAKHIRHSNVKHSSLPSPAWSMESGFESMISSPVSVIEEESSRHTVLCDEALDKNDGKPLSMLRDDLIRCDKVLEVEKSVCAVEVISEDCEKPELETGNDEAHNVETGNEGSIHSENIVDMPLTRKSVFEPDDVLETTGNFELPHAEIWPQVEDVTVGIDLLVAEEKNISKPGNEPVHHEIVPLTAPESPKPTACHIEDTTIVEDCENLTYEPKDSSEKQTDVIQVTVIEKHTEDNLASDDEISGEMIAKIFSTCKLPSLVLPLSKKHAKSKPRVKECIKKDAVAQVEQLQTDCSTQTDQPLIAETTHGATDPDLIMFKHFKMFMSMFRKLKRRRPKVGQWVVENVKEKKRKVKYCERQLVKSRKCPRKVVDRVISCSGELVNRIDRPVRKCGSEKPMVIQESSDEGIDEPIVGGREEQLANQARLQEVLMDEEILTRKIPECSKKTESPGILKSSKMSKHSDDILQVVDGPFIQGCLKNSEPAFARCLRSSEEKTVGDYLHGKSSNTVNEVLTGEVPEGTILAKTPPLTPKSPETSKCLPNEHELKVVTHQEEEPIIQECYRNVDTIETLETVFPKSLKSFEEKEVCNELHEKSSKETMVNEVFTPITPKKTILAEPSPLTPRSPETSKYSSNKDEMKVFAHEKEEPLTQRRLSNVHSIGNLEAVIPKSGSEDDNLRGTPKSPPRLIPEFSKKTSQGESSPLTPKYRQKRSKHPADESKGVPYPSDESPINSNCRRNVKSNDDSKPLPSESEASMDSTEPLMKNRVMDLELDKPLPQTTVRKSPRFSMKRTPCVENGKRCRSPSPVHDDRAESTRKSLRLSAEKLQTSEPVKRTFSTLFDSSSDEDDEEKTLSERLQNLAKKRTACNLDQIPRLENESPENDVPLTTQEPVHLFTRYRPQILERPFTRSQKPVAVPNKLESSSEVIDFKPKPVRISLLSAEVKQLPAVIASNPVPFLNNFEELWERSRMMKMKPSVLSQQIRDSPPKPLQPLPEPSLPVCSIRERKKSTGNFFEDILTNMDQPPVVPHPVIIPSVTPEVKKSKKKKKKKMSEKPTEPLVIPAPSFESKEEEMAWNSLENFLKAQNATAEAATQSVKTCIAALDQVGDNVLVKTVVNIIKENVDERADFSFTPPAPPLTPTQQRLFALMRAYKRLNGLHLDIADEIYSVLLPERFTWYDDVIESCAMFLGALYRQVDDVTGAAQLCVNAAAGMRQRGCLVVNAVLAAWPEILPLAVNADPWGPGATVALLVMSTPIPVRENQQISLRRLKSLLNGYYGYDREVNVENWTRKAIEALRKGDIAAGHALAAVAPICKVSSIVAPLLESLGVWEFGGVADEIALKMLDILTVSFKTCSRNTSGRRFCQEHVPRIAEILLAKKVSFAGQEAIVKLISKLSTKKNKFHAIFEKWTPDEAVSKPIYSAMMSAIQRSQSKPIRNPPPKMATTKKKKKKKKKKQPVG